MLSHKYKLNGFFFKNNIFINVIKLKFFLYVFFKNTALAKALRRKEMALNFASLRLCENN